MKGALAQALDRLRWLAPERRAPRARAKSSGNCASARSYSSRERTRARRRRTTGAGRDRVRRGKRADIVIPLREGPRRSPERCVAYQGRRHRRRVHLSRDSRTGRRRGSFRARAFVASAPRRRRDRRHRRPDHPKAHAISARILCQRSLRDASCLNEMARVRMRPSISGSTTFIARSAAPRPRVEPLHCSCVEPASTICNTGASAASRTPPPSSTRAEKAVALRMTSNGVFAR